MVRVGLRPTQKCSEPTGGDSARLTVYRWRQECWSSCWRRDLWLMRLYPMKPRPKIYLSHLELLRRGFSSSHTGTIICQRSLPASVWTENFQFPYAKQNKKTLSKAKACVLRSKPLHEAISLYLRQAYVCVPELAEGKSHLPKSVLFIGVCVRSWRSGLSITLLT